MTDKRSHRKNEIIQAAIGIFGKHGYHEAKMKDIATEVGIGKATLYEYFSSKKELFRQAVGYKINSYTEGIEKIVAQQGTMRESLIAFAVYHGQFMQEHHSKAEMIFMKSDALPEEFMQWIMEGRGRVVQLMFVLIEEGMAREELRGDLDKHLLAVTILGAVKEYYLDKMYFSQGGDVDMDPAPLIDMLIRGVAE